MRNKLFALSFLAALFVAPLAQAQDVVRHFTPLVGTAGSETSLAVSPSSIFEGTPVTLKADVQPTNGGPSPTGTVSFYLFGGYLLGSAPVEGTTASLTLPTLKLGTGKYFIDAVYSGDKNYKGSTSSDSYFTVTCDTNSTSDMSASPSSLKPGGIVTLATDVSPNQGGPIPTGTVLFFETHGTYLGSAPLIAGVATLKVSTAGIAPGTYTVVSVYQGSSIYLPSTSEIDTVVVE